MQRGWQADAKPYRIESVVTSDANGHDGKAAIWRGSFASPAQRSTVCVAVPGTHSITSRVFWPMFCTREWQGT